MVEQANTAIGASKHEFARETASRFLPRHISAHPLDIGISGHAVEERESRIPFLSDHAISALLGRQIMAEGDEAICVVTRNDLIDGRADTAPVNVKTRP